MQDDKNKVDLAREKYLALDYSLNPDEQAIIDRDLNGADYVEFCRPTTIDWMLPKQYSADITYKKIEECIRKQSLPSKNLFGWKYWAVAASIALLVSISLFHLNKKSGPTFKQLTVSTSRGETIEIILPDSSVVILNSLSTLSYPEQFEEKARNIILNGEGYFKVKKDSQKPFKVQTGEISVEVLGTRFNIRSYSNDSTIETALLEGSVAIHYGKQHLQILLPGEVAFYNKANSTLQVETANLSNVIQWKQGFLIFEDRPLAEIFHTLERQDQVSFDVQDPAIKKLKVTARFIHHESTQEIVEILSRSAPFSFREDNGTFHIFQNIKR